MHKRMHIRLQHRVFIEIRISRACKKIMKKKRIDHGFELIEMRHYDRYGEIIKIQISEIPAGMKPRKDISIGLGGKSKVIRVCILCHRRVRSRVPAHEECMKEYVRQMSVYDKKEGRNGKS